MKLKTCKTCHVEKPMTEAHFPARILPSGNTYFRPDCKLCTNELLRGKALERMRRLRAADGGQSARENVARWKRANPDKRAAHHHGNVRERALPQQRPKWGGRRAMFEAYKAARAMRAVGIDVQIDHVIPLNGELVCGLHVINNLDFVTTSENTVKGNSFDPDRWVEPIW